jgi:RNA polymerase primary sigma factor
VRLTAQQEQELVVAAEGGDPAARRQLVEAFLPGIGGLARRFGTALGVERRDLLQEGVAGLLFAARRYDPGLNTPFWAYASFWVRKAMQELVAELTGPVALSDRAVRRSAAIRAARNQHQQSYGREPTTGELSRATGFTRAQVESLLAAERPPRSVEQWASVDPDATTTFGSWMADPAAERAFEQVLDDIEMHEVRDLAEQLDDRERAVIRAHYGLGQPPQTLTKIGSALGLTAERARQIEVGALRKLRAALSPAAPELDGFPSVRAATAPFTRTG